ncbi:hypothetical protein HYPSUDRAFT_558978 [Hypholoma sublateritium FD-334 SS-4]|uniref:Uncharacterized protein n=1 Tax=Hypholoma sublateritium (strain FD-334 SS-4) TaxID=945553 RepID=A0A0D2NYN0_HYPSF|nr:hypothetical protein HYPSUDRAFT_558978 [Hypholoma sublateritium FD-334 SS-4]
MSDSKYIRRSPSTSAGCVRPRLVPCMAPMRAVIMMGIMRDRSTPTHIHKSHPVHENAVYHPDPSIQSSPTYRPTDQLRHHVQVPCRHRARPRCVLQRRLRADDPRAGIRPGAHAALRRRAAGGTFAYSALTGYVPHSAAAWRTRARRRAARVTLAPGSTTTSRCASRPQHRGQLRCAAGGRCLGISCGSVTSVRDGGFGCLYRESPYRRLLPQCTNFFEESPFIS